MSEVAAAMALLILIGVTAWDLIETWGVGEGGLSSAGVTKNDGGETDG